MSDPTSAETATRWLLTVYTNELNWLFCWSYFFMVEPAQYAPSTETFLDRLGRWWGVVKSPESRKTHLYSPVTKRKYYAFYVSMTFMALARLMLNLAGFFLIIWAIRDYAPKSTDYSEDANLPYEYTIRTFHALATHRLAKIGGWCLLASTILHLFMYTTHRYHLVRLLLHGGTNKSGEGEFSTPAYWLGHVGLFNWVLDVPGFRVPTVQWVHIFIILVNITAGLVFFCIYYFKKPVTLAWGCYAPGTSFLDLKYGLCPAYINNPLNAHPPVCDQPGTRCGEEEIRWKNMYNHTIIHTAVMCTFSFIVYLISVSAKTKFYLLSRDLVVKLNSDKTL